MTILPKMVPHTAAKHLLLKRYLDRWFPILGKYNSRINYIDGFAGPGEYEAGEPGSPLLVIEAAKYHVEHGTLAANVNIDFIFVEVDPGFADHLQSKLSTLTLPPQFDVSVTQGEFANVIGGVLDDLEKQSKVLAPTFAFVDPFGFSGVPFDLMARILAHPKCEVYVNIMIEFINRFLEHPDDSVLRHFPNTFGTDEVLKIPQQPGNRIKALLSLYRRQLKSKARFVGRFDMHDRNDQKTYSLFFASNSPKGFEKMKEANWSVDKTEGGRFSDFEPGAVDQTGLLETTITHLGMKYSTQMIPGAASIKCSISNNSVIEETDYLPKHARNALKAEREQSGEISVEVGQGQKRRKGEFPTGKVLIVFP